MAGCALPGTPQAGTPGRLSLGLTQLAEGLRNEMMIILLDSVQQAAGLCTKICVERFIQQYEADRAALLQGALVVPEKCVEVDCAAPLQGSASGMAAQSPERSQKALNGSEFHMPANAAAAIEGPRKSPDKNAPAQAQDRTAAPGTTCKVATSAPGVETSAANKEDVESEAAATSHGQRWSIPPLAMEQVEQVGLEPPGEAQYFNLAANSPGGLPEAQYDSMEESSTLDTPDDSQRSVGSATALNQRSATAELCEDSEPVQRRTSDTVSMVDAALASLTASLTSPLSPEANQAAFQPEVLANDEPTAESRRGRGRGRGRASISVMESQEGQRLEDVKLEIKEEDSYGAPSSLNVADGGAVRGRGRGRGRGRNSLVASGSGELGAQANAVDQSGAAPARGRGRGRRMTVDTGSLEGVSGLFAADTVDSSLANDSQDIPGVGLTKVPGGRGRGRGRGSRRVTWAGTEAEAVDLTNLAAELAKTSSLERDVQDDHNKDTEKDVVPESSQLVAANEAQAIPDSSGSVESKDAGPLDAKVESDQNAEVEQNRAKDQRRVSFATEEAPVFHDQTFHAKIAPAQKSEVEAEAIADKDVAELLGPPGQAACLQPRIPAPVASLSVPSLCLPSMGMGGPPSLGSASPSTATFDQPTSKIAGEPESEGKPQVEGSAAKQDTAQTQEENAASKSKEQVLVEVASPEAIRLQKRHSVHIPQSFELPQNDDVTPGEGGLKRRATWSGSIPGLEQGLEGISKSDRKLPAKIEIRTTKTHEMRLKAAKEWRSQENYPPWKRAAEEELTSENQSTKPKKKLSARAKVAQNKDVKDAKDVKVALDKREKKEPKTTPKTKTAGRRKSHSGSLERRNSLQRRRHSAPSLDHPEHEVLFDIEESQLESQTEDESGEEEDTMSGAESSASSNSYASSMSSNPLSRSMEQLEGEHELLRADMEGLTLPEVAKTLPAVLEEETEQETDQEPNSGRGGDSKSSPKSPAKGEVSDAESRKSVIDGAADGQNEDNIESGSSCIPSSRDEWRLCSVDDGVACRLPSERAEMQRRLGGQVRVVFQDFLEEVEAAGFARSLHRDVDLGAEGQELAKALQALPLLDRLTQCHDAVKVELDGSELVLWDCYIREDVNMRGTMDVSDIPGFLQIFAGPDRTAEASRWAVEVPEQRPLDWVSLLRWWESESQKSAVASADLARLGPRGIRKETLEDRAFAKDIEELRSCLHMYERALVGTCCWKCEQRLLKAWQAGGGAPEVEALVQVLSLISDLLPPAEQVLWHAFGAQDSNFDGACTVEETLRGVADVAADTATEASELSESELHELRGCILKEAVERLFATPRLCRENSNSVSLADLLSWWRGLPEEFRAASGLDVSHVPDVPGVPRVLFAKQIEILATDNERLWVALCGQSRLLAELRARELRGTFHRMWTDTTPVNDGSNYSRARRAVRRQKNLSEGVALPSSSKRATICVGTGSAIFSPTAVPSMLPSAPLAAPPIYAAPPKVLTAKAGKVVEPQTF